MTNWEIYILELIEESVLSYRTQYDNVVEEITKCFCYGFITLNRRYELLSYLDDSRKEQEYNDKVYHEQRLYDIRAKQDKIREQREIAEVLSHADNLYKKSVANPRGRPRKNT